MTARRSRTRGTKARRQGPADAVEETTTSQEPQKASRSPKAKTSRSKAKGTKTSQAKRARGRPRVSNTDTDRITLRIEKEHLQTIDLLVKLRQYSNRSDAIRQAIKHFCDDALDDVEGLIEQQQKKQKLAQLAALTDELNELREQ